MSEELIIRHCSPTLAGLKTGNMFRCVFETEKDMKKQIISFNKAYRSKGICAVPLKVGKNSVLIYIYRPSKLKIDFQNNDVVELLVQYGYQYNLPQKCIARLISKLKSCDIFPHEIGLFLGYPPEDVRGFIENKAECSKCVGCWKVYGDEKKAGDEFRRYRNCTRIYTKLFNKGYSIDRLMASI